MKKIILLLALSLFTANCANAQQSFYGQVKNLFHKKAPIQKPSEDADFTKSEQAVVLYNENNVKGAFETLLSIKETDRTAQDWLLLGNILQDQEKTADAAFMYQRSMMVDAKYYKPYYNLGNIYLEEDKPYLAIDNYRKANKLNNEFSYAYYNLGCAYLKIGKLNNAKIAFLKAVELKNTVPDFHYNLAYTYKMLKKPKLAKQYLSNYNKLMEAAAQ